MDQDHSESKMENEEITLSNKLPAAENSGMADGNSVIDKITITS